MFKIFKKQNTDYVNQIKNNRQIKKDIENYEIKDLLSKYIEEYYKTLPEEQENIKERIKNMCFNVIEIAKGNTSEEKVVYIINYVGKTMQQIIQFERNEITLEDIVSFQIKN